MPNVPPSRDTSGWLFDRQELEFPAFDLTRQGILYIYSEPLDKETVRELVRVKGLRGVRQHIFIRPETTPTTTPPVQPAIVGTRNRVVTNLNLFS